MKRHYILFSFLLLTLPCLSQNKDTERADKLFARYEYVDAAQQYLELVNKGKADGYVYRQLADCYYNVFNTVEAARWYAKAVESSSDDPEVYYRYGQMLKGQGKYEESNAQMRRFSQLLPNDQRAKAFMENPNYIPKLLGLEKLYEVSSLGISSDKGDFGPVLYDNQLYFTSARNDSRKTYGWNQEPFLDLYSAIRNTDGSFSQPEPLTKINTQYHDGPLSITADGKTMYFAGDSFREKKFSRDREQRLKLGRNNLYRATKGADSWSNIERLSISTADYSVANPSITRDGKMLYFSSDMSGSIGGVDIWRVVVNADGSLGTPENLGSRVNTEGNESFPYIDDDNTTLYFASSGRPGFGGLDIYKVDLSKTTPAQNMGKPINTEKDDFSFTYSQSQSIGFFASNRSGNDDLFSATPLCSLELITRVTDAKTGAVLAGAKVAILDDRNNIISTELANEQGEVTYMVECNKAHVIQASHTGYESGTFPVKGEPKGGKRLVEAKLNAIEQIITPTQVVLNPIYFEFNKHNITREGAFELDKLVEAMNSKPELVIMVKSHTDSRGSDAYNLSLSDRRARATVQYIISKGISKNRISGKGYGESEPKVACGESCTEEQHAQNRRSEFLIVSGQ